MIKRFRNHVLFCVLTTLLYPCILCGQLVVEGTSFATSPNTDLYIDGHVYVAPNSKLWLRGGLTVSGNLIGKGSVQELSKLTLYGKKSTTLLLQQGHVDSLYLSKSPHSDLFLQGDSLNISFLHFSGRDQYLFINDTDLNVSESISGYGEHNFIHTNGTGMVLRKLSTHPVIFPIGDYVNGFQPVFLSAADLRVHSGRAKVAYYLFHEGTEASGKRRPVWKIENNHPVHLHYHWGSENNMQNKLFRLNDLRLKAWNGLDWVLVGFDSLSGNISSGYLRTRMLQANEFSHYQFASVISFEEQDSEKEKNLELLPAFPNPFSGSSSVNFRLREESEVTIQLFGPGGALIKEMKNKYPPGYHFENLNESLFHVPGKYLLIIKDSVDMYSSGLLKMSY
jgi:hypothetical protein